MEHTLATPREKPSILGVWYLQTVYIEGQLSNDSTPFSNVVEVKPGANGHMYTKDHKALHLVYGNILDENSYRAFGDSLIVFDSANVYRERILDLTPTRLVKVLVTDKPEGYFKTTTTFKRTSLKELKNLRQRFLSSE
ncbi:hypothetical protein [Hymenobacter yonginensis]|uniref:Lipocalin-like domain-containing protein n=1 Tax=Hymenobacter yonginensis TaxID=748197 RepID=A0ABY7PV17_9BACT|nr:hypothetical protein [Hymenobacter yonginensis]WBO86699.1 hypothetical protein O9Z63_20680 [Hymenobacter yonginensis]